MIIALIIVIPLTAIVSVYGTLKAVQLGLRWKVQVENKEEPTLKVPVVDNYKETQARKLQEAIVKEQNQTLNEWLGVEEE